MFEFLSSPYTGLDYFLAAMDIGVPHLKVREISESWGMRVDAFKSASLHYCLEGAGVLAVHGGPSIPLEPHTFVLLQPGVAYGFVGTGQQGIVMACGELRVELVGGADPFASLREPLVARFDDTDGLRDQFAMLLAESTQPGVGSRALTEALVKQCLVLALRRWVACDAQPLPWLAGVSDARLSRALCAIFNEPAVAYTVDSLAMIAGMSRSAFAAAFRRAFGQSPMNLVKLVRLRRASGLLITTALPVAEVAKRVGFSSRSNFSLAFNELHGVDPTGFRRTFAEEAKSYWEANIQQSGVSPS